MGRMAGKVAFVTGAARGQGRSHALTLAREGADIVAVDLVDQLESVPYPMATTADMAETVKLVEELDRRIVAEQGDVREVDAMQRIVAAGLAEFGHIDVVSANAGICSIAGAREMSAQTWNEMIDTNLTGVWNSIQAVLPSMIDAGRGGSIVITSSIYGIKGPLAGLAHYAASKHGVVGLMRELANELAPHRIRVNTVNPTFVGTDMILNDALYRCFLPDSADPDKEEFAGLLQTLNALPIPWVEPQDISNAVLFLASEEARYVTGTTMLVDAGAVGK